uniref:Uncharacterized protein n=1 Tax=Tetranychus urticae TaxID=32264 RepID=T1L4I1_TETUR
MSRSPAPVFESAAALLRARSEARLGLKTIILSPIFSWNIRETTRAVRFTIFTLVLWLTWSSTLLVSTTKTIEGKTAATKRKSISTAVASRSFPATNSSEFLVKLQGKASAKQYHYEAPSYLAISNGRELLWPINKCQNPR